MTCDYYFLLFAPNIECRCVLQLSTVYGFKPKLRKLMYTSVIPNFPTIKRDFPECSVYGLINTIYIQTIAVFCLSNVLRFPLLFHLQ